MKILPTSWVPSLRFFESFPPSHLGNSNKFDCTRFVVGFGSQCRFESAGCRFVLLALASLANGHVGVEFAEGGEEAAKFVFADTFQYLVQD